VQAKHVLQKAGRITLPLMILLAPQAKLTHPSQLLLQNKPTSSIVEEFDASPKRIIFYHFDNMAIKGL